MASASTPGTAGPVGILYPACGSSSSSGKFLGRIAGTRNFDQLNKSCVVTEQQPSCDSSWPAAVDIMLFSRQVATGCQEVTSAQVNLLQHIYQPFQVGVGEGVSSYLLTGDQYGPMCRSSSIDMPCTGGGLQHVHAEEACTQPSICWCHLMGCCGF